MKDLAVIVMAAGLGTRMRSDTAKVLHTLGGRPMLLLTLGNALTLKPERLVVVTGHQSDKVCAILPGGVETVLQEEQKGTAHAALTGLSALKGFDGTVLLVSGDTPLLSAETFKGLLARHRRAKAQLTILTAALPDPSGYGRIMRGKSGVERIVEHRDAAPEELKVTEVNTGTYCFEAKALRSALRKVRSENAQKEFYLTDAAAIISRGGGKVLGVEVEDPGEAMGINSRADLARAEHTLRRRINRKLMESGVTMLDPDATYIDAGVVIGRDTVVHPGCHITGNTVIGKGCMVLPGNLIADSTVKDGAVIKGYSVLTEACVDEGASVGPFAHLRPGSRVGQKAKVGNFVETKKTLIGVGSKASHLSYLGDSIIGRDVNIGAGTITCNYDGYKKYQTVIEDGVFVGSDTQLVAPVRVGRGAVVAAGTTVTGDVPDDARAISRAPQVNREGWAKKFRERKG